MFACTERIAFYLGSYPIMKYGITMGIAIAVAIVLLLKFRKKYYPEFSEDTLVDLTFWLVIAGVVGARLWFVLLNLSYFAKNPFEILMINHGGISIQGAIAGGVAAGYFYVKKHNLDFFKLSDLYALVLPIGQAIGRWGNFFNSEAFGRPCNLPWKLYIPIENRPSAFVNEQFFHPTFLYESIANVFVFLILFLVLRKYFQGKDGALFFSYLILYSFVRFFIEFVRVDSVLNVGAVPVAAIVSVVLFLVGAFGLYYVVKAHKSV